MLLEKKFLKCANSMIFPFKTIFRPSLGLKGHLTPQKQEADRLNSSSLSVVGFASACVCMLGSYCLC